MSEHRKKKRLPRPSASLDALAYMRAEREYKARELLHKQEQRKAASLGGNRKRIRTERKIERMFVDLTVRLRVRLRFAIDGCDTYHMAVQTAQRNLRGPGRPFGVLLPESTLVTDQVVLDGKNPAILSVVAVTEEEESADAVA